MKETHDVSFVRAELNGKPVGFDDWRFFAMVNYGHFTSMQVCDHHVRGLHLHLERLDRSTQELFGVELNPDLVRAHIQHVLGNDSRSMSLRVSVFSRALDFERLATPAMPDILVTTNPPAESPSIPLRVQSIQYERLLPHIKHVGTFGLFYYPRQASINGFDDVLFLTTDGSVSEGSIWNIGFFDGKQVVLPNAPALPGITMQLLRTGLERKGIPWEIRNIHLEDLISFKSAFITNSISIGQPIASIDKHKFVVDQSLMTELKTCYETNPLEAI